MTRLALVGDHNPAVVAHRAIPRALAKAAAATGVELEWHWVATETIRDATQDLAGFDAVWCVPASPYRNMDGALAAIRFARERDLPFLGTCGGFQHAVLDFARHVAGIHTAAHAETDPTASDPIVTPLACSLVEKSGDISFAAGSRLHAIFGGRSTTESYHCNYGVNAAYRARLESAGLRFTGFDSAGDIRAFELPANRFHVGTLFQPERAALTDRQHPLIEAFVRAIRH